MLETAERDYVGSFAVHLLRSNLFQSQYEFCAQKQHELKTFYPDGKNKMCMTVSMSMCDVCRETERELEVEVEREDGNGHVDVHPVRVF